ncbi:MAG: proton-conducting transporter membrane subunit [Desulfurococcaceae archaeon]
MTGNLIGLLPFIPVFAAFLLPLIYMASKKRLVVMYYTVIAVTIVLVLSVLVAIEAYRANNPLVFMAGGWPAPIGIIYTVDRFTAALGVVSTVVIAAIALYSVSYIVDDGYPWYSILLLGVTSGILGVTYTGDMFNLFVMLEVTGISAYSLVMYYRHRALSIVAGLKYAFIGSLGTTLYLLAMGLVYSFYGTLNFVDFSLRLVVQPDFMHALAYGIIMVLALWAFSIKSGVFPNHFWLPDAHPAAPTPISALLSGLVVNVGVIGLYKFVYIASWNTPVDPLNSARRLVLLVTVVMGALSALFGALLMGIQRDVKRLIAYSTVMNLGFLFMGIGCGTSRGLQATLYYIAAHTLAKATLFLSVGVLIKATGTRELEKLSGLGLKYPIAGTALAVSTLALAGIPPLPGFLAKLLLYEALFEYNVILSMMMVIASAIGLLSYMKLFYTILLGVPVVKIVKIDMKAAYVSLVVLTLLVTAFGVAFLFSPQLLQDLFKRAADQVSVGIESYIEYVNATLTRP